MADTGEAGEWDGDPPGFGASGAAEEHDLDELQRIGGYAHGSQPSWPAHSVPGKGGLVKFFGSFRYAGHGVTWMVRHQQNMRFHIIASACVIALGIGLAVPMSQWALLVFAITLVLVCEGLNSAVEAVMDLVHPAHHEMVRIIKDVMAGATLLAALGSASIGALVFIPHIVHLISG